MANGSNGSGFNSVLGWGGALLALLVGVGLLVFVLPLNPAGRDASEASAIIPPDPPSDVLNSTESGQPTDVVVDDISHLHSETPVPAGEEDPVLTVTEDPVELETAEADADPVPTDDSPQVTPISADTIAPTPEATPVDQAHLAASKSDVDLAGAVPHGMQFTTVIEPTTDGSRQRCIYVELLRQAGAPARPPPALWSDRVSQRLEWQETPAPDNVLPMIARTCARGWSQAMSRDVERALLFDGSWFATTSDGQTILIYALRHEFMIRVDRTLDD